VASLDASRKRLGFLLCGYVIMPDHWHGLIATQYPVTISDCIRDIKSVSARRLNRQRQRRGPVWQHQFWDRFVRHAKEYSERLDYLHDNPVRKGLVARPQDWRWSSFQNLGRSQPGRTTHPIKVDYVILPENYRG
jgi:REP element-mobilizing transposase RayT